jgi:NAD(P)-dependent dehydrogenase (short-subunit alcohol dehydrogenase family)
MAQQNGVKIMTKKLLITGASKGIGYQTAKIFSQKGYKVLNLSRSNCDIEGVENIKIDLTEQKKLSDILSGEVSSFVKQDKDPTVIVHNSALLTKDNYESLEYEDFIDVFKINVLAVQQINKALLPQLEDNSALIYIGSTLSEKAGINCLSYTSTKHALAGLMKSTAQDLGNRKIHSCMICPGFTDTEMLREQTGGNMDFAIEKTLFRRLVQPEEIAKIIYDSSLSPALNGSVIHANLGQTD